MKQKIQNIEKKSELGILLLVEEHPMRSDEEYSELYLETFDSYLSKEQVSDALERLRNKELISVCYTLRDGVPFLSYRVRKANAVGIEWSMVRNIVSRKEDIKKLYRKIIGGRMIL